MKGRVQARLPDDDLQDLQLLAKVRGFSECASEATTVQAYRLARKRAGKWWGGTYRAVESLRSGSHPDALHAALAVADLISHGNATQGFICKGTIRGMLQVVSTITQVDEYAKGVYLAVLTSLLRVVCDTRDGAGCLVQAFFDPDDCVAYNALTLSGPLFSVPGVGSRMLAAGFAPALVAVLPGLPPGWQSTAAAALCTVAEGWESLEALRTAGLVPALMRVLGVSPAGDSHPLLVRGNTAEQLRHLPGGTVAQVLPPGVPPPPLMYSVLAYLMVLSSKVAQEVAAFPGLAAVLLHSLEHHVGDAASEGPARLLLMCSLRVLSIDNKPQREVFASALASDPRFGRVILSLIESDCSTVVQAGVVTIGQLAVVLGDSCLSWEWLVTIATALAIHIEAGTPADDQAAVALGMLTTSCKSMSGEGYALSRALKVTAKLVINLARIMVKLQGKENFFLFVFILDLLRHSKGEGDEDFLTAALSGGFVPASLDLLRSTRIPLSQGHCGVDVPRRAIVWQAVHWVLRRCEKRFVVQALKCRLLDELQWDFQDGSQTSSVDTVYLLWALSRDSEGLEWLRAAGIWPKLVADFATRCLPLALLLIGLEVKKMARYTAPHLAAELLDHGVLDTLKARSMEEGMRSIAADLSHVIKALEGVAVAIHETTGCQETSPGFVPAPAEDLHRADAGEATAAESLARKPEMAAQSTSITTASGHTAQDAASTLPHASSGLEAGLKASSANGGCEMSGDRPDPTHSRAGPERSWAELGDRGGGQAALEAHCASGACGSRVGDARRRRRALVCAQCGTSGQAGQKIRECGNCGLVLYCGRKCQVAHWPSHRTVCKSHGTPLK